MPPILIETQTNDEFIQRSAALMGDAIRNSIEDHGHCILGLSGGSTPRSIYTQLSTDPEIEWHRVWMFLVDERYTPAESPESNVSLVEETLLRSTESSSIHLLRPDTSLPLPICITDYETALERLFDEKGSPDVVTLGLGEDGHIASLFPPLAENAFGPQTVIHTTTDTFTIRDRISVTLPTLRQTPHVFFFLKGENKKKVWQEMMSSGEDAKRWPAKFVMEYGETTVVLGQ